MVSPFSCNYAITICYEKLCKLVLSRDFPHTVAHKICISYFNAGTQLHFKLIVLVLICDLEMTAVVLMQLEMIGINIIAAFSWPPPLISQLFSLWLFEATPFFTAWLFWN